MVVSTEEAVDPGTTGTEGFGRDVQQLAAYFYAGDGILVSTCAACLQRGFDTLTELFDRVVLRTNVVNMVSMGFQPFLALGGHSMEVYGLQMTGKGHIYRERLHQRVHCTDCNADLMTVSLDSRRQVQNRVYRGDLKDPPPPPHR